MSQVFQSIAQRTAQNRANALERQQKRKQNHTPRLDHPSTSSSESTINVQNQQEQQAPDNARKRKKMASMNLNYCEFNFSTMHDTKGGFLVDEASSSNNTGSESNQPQTVTRKVVYEIPPNIDITDNPRCEKCKTIDIDANYETYFAVNVCRKCIKEYPDEYSLLTKTETRQDYLLTESELKDSSRLPVWEKPNPHKSTYSNMMLYLRKQVEAFAWEKWGSPEALDEEFVKRDELRSSRKAKKFKTKLAELRKKTMTRSWMAEREAESKHEHQYEEPTPHPSQSDTFIQRCITCGFEMSFESF